MVYKIHKVYMHSNKGQVYQTKSKIYCFITFPDIGISNYLKNLADYPLA